METPFYSSIGRGSTSTPSPQLIEEELNAVVQNSAVEGFDFPSTPSPTVDGDQRRSYSTQIFEKTVRVTGTQQANDTVGVTNKKELAEQLALRGMELKRDVEWSIMGDKATASNDNGVTVTAPQLAAYAQGAGGGSATVGRQITDYIGQVHANVAATGASADVTGSTSTGMGRNGLLRGTGANLGTAAAWTTSAVVEGSINTVARKLYESGGLTYKMGNAQVKNANMICLSPANKVNFDNALDTKTNTRRDIGGDGSIQGVAFTKYNSSFGTFMVCPDQFQADNYVAIYNPQNWKWVTLRPMHTQEIAKIGDSERRQIVMEGTLIHRHTQASGAIVSLSTSR